MMGLGRSREKEGRCTKTKVPATVIFCHVLCRQLVTVKYDDGLDIMVKQHLNHAHEIPNIPAHKDAELSGHILNMDPVSVRHGHIPVRPLHTPPSVLSAHLSVGTPSHSSFAQL
jgi:hypothetical protein